MTAADDAWQRGRVPFKFQIGDIILATIALPLIRRSARLGEKALEIDDIPTPPASFEGAAGYVVWSQPLARARPALGFRPDAIIYTPRQYRRFSAELTGDFAQYAAHFSGKTRSTLNRKLRKFAEASSRAIDWRAYRTAEEIARFLPLARQVSAKSYQERRLRAGLPGDPKFADKALALAAADRLRAFLLFINDEPVSYLYCPINDGVVIYDRLGYDPAYASLSPGTVLQFLALQALFEERRFSLFDFTEGEGQHKEMFSTQSVECGDVFVLNRRIAPFTVVIFHRAVEKSAAAAAALAARWGLRNRIRRARRRPSGTTARPPSGPGA